MPNKRQRPFGWGPIVAVIITALVMTSSAANILGWYGLLACPNEPPRATPRIANGLHPENPENPHPGTSPGMTIETDRHQPERQNRVSLAAQPHQTPAAAAPVPEAAGIRDTASGRSLAYPDCKPSP